MRVAKGLRRWARYALVRHYAGLTHYNTFERLHAAALRAEDRLERSEVMLFVEWASFERSKRAP